MVTHRFVPSSLCARRRRRDRASGAALALLASGCRLLQSTPPALVRAASISFPVSSAGEGRRLAARLQVLAAGSSLSATVMASERRVRIRLVRSALDLGVSDGDR